MCSDDRDEFLLQQVTLLTEDHVDGSERRALVKVEPEGFHLRPPLKPHDMKTPFTPEDELFQTIHMGAAVVDKDSWQLVIDGLVERPFSVSWQQLLKLPRTTITSFHECYGSPVKPPTDNVWRVGNVQWTGVPLNVLLKLARPKKEAQYIWSDGLEHGAFAQITADRYQKDLPLRKALSPEVIVAYAMNGEQLGLKRGGPVRLVVPGWFGTNSTKWLCRISLQSHRATGPFTTKYYNEIDPTDPQKQKIRPVWAVEPNSCILTLPSSESKLQGPIVKLEGRAWGCYEIEFVEVGITPNDDKTSEIASCPRSKHEFEWIRAKLQSRAEFEWQAFETNLELKSGKYLVIARATSKDGTRQPLEGRRNHVHQIEIEVA